MAQKKLAPRPTRRPRRSRVRRPPPGTYPGHIHVDPQAPRSQIQVLAYGPDSVAAGENVSVADLTRFLDAAPVTWVDVVGLGSEEVLRALGEQYGLHLLALEDVVNVYQRPKVTSYGSYFQVVLRLPRMDGEMVSEQISLFAGPGWLLSFQERAGDAFEPVRQRIRNPGRPIRELGSDYLAYALVDATLDAYFPLLEDLGDELERLQDEILVQPRRELLQQVYETRHTLSHLRRATWPMRELLNAMIRDPLPGMTEETRVYLRDCYDHAILAMELTESYRDMGAELMDFYLSSLGNRTNEIVKVLTITGAIFIPLTFIAGLYGMNFEHGQNMPYNMPELAWRYGYPAVLLVMLTIAGAMLWFFHRKGWLE